MLKYLTYGLIFGITYLIGLVITPINYIIKDWLREKYPDTIWWFLNDRLPLGDKDIDAGDYGRFKHTPLGFYKQNALRNPHWNLKLLLSPKYEKPVYTKGTPETISTTWNPKFKILYSEFSMKGEKYFRVSWLIKILWWYNHGQLGTTHPPLPHKPRYVYKVKSGKIKKLNIK